MDKTSSIKKACQITDQTFKYALEKIKTGITEKELAGEINKSIRKQGARLAFRTIVAFGKSAFEIHHKPTNIKLTRNQFVLLDFGAKFNGYCADMSRTVVFGKATGEQKKIYNAVLIAQEKAIKVIKPNCKTYEIDKVARDYIFKKGFNPIPHSLGHGVGKKVHEKPRISPMSPDILKIGDIFTIEPGIYIKNFGGVRIEDVLILQKGRARALTHSPKHLIEV
ncbi:MAG: M24 family metallopeptidase [Candidatus Levyibacteriota bacterium]